MSALNEPIAAPAARPEFGLNDVIDFLLMEKWLIGVTTVLVTGAAIVLAFLTTPVYKVETVLAPVDTDRNSSIASLAGQFTGLAAMAGISFGGGGEKEEAIGVLQSRALAGRFITENNLLPVLYADKWDAAHKKWQVSSQEDIPTMWGAIKRFQDKIFEVKQDPITGLVTVAIQWTDPVVASRWAGDITRMANAILQRRAIREAERSIEFLKVELAKTSLIEVQDAISRVIEAQTKALTMASVQDEFAFRIIDPPTAPDLQSPVKPRKRLIAAVGLVLGAMLGVLLAVLRALLRQRSKRRIHA